MSILVVGFILVALAVAAYLVFKKDPAIVTEVKADVSKVETTVQTYVPEIGAVITQAVEDVKKNV